MLTWLIAARLLAATLKIAVLPVVVEPSAKDRVPALIDDYVLTAVHELGGYVVIGQDDVNTMLGFERQKDLLGCDDTTCFAEIGGALGADKLLVFKVAWLEGRWATSAKVIDLRQAAAERRTTRMLVGDSAALLDAVASVVRELFAVREAHRAVPAHAVDDEAPQVVDVSGTEWELRLGASQFSGGRSDAQASPSSGEELVRRVWSIAPALLFKGYKVGAAALWVELAPGWTKSREATATTSGTTYADATRPFAQLTLIGRLHIWRGREPAWLLPRDLVALDLGVGLYRVASGAKEYGGSLRAELGLGWLVLGAELDRGASSGWQPAVRVGVRVGH